MKNFKYISKLRVILFSINLSEITMNQCRNTSPIRIRWYCFINKNMHLSWLITIGRDQTSMRNTIISLHVSIIYIRWSGAQYCRTDHNNNALMVTNPIKINIISHHTIRRWGWNILHVSKLTYTSIRQV